MFQPQQPFRIAVIDQLTIRSRAIQLFDEFCGHIAAGKGMIGAVKQVIGPHGLITALQRFSAVADSVDVELAEVVIDWPLKARRVGNQRGRLVEGGDAPPKDRE